MFIHNLLIYYQYCYEEKRRKKEEKKRRRLQKKEERKRHFRKWNEWRKRNLNSKFYQLLILLKVFRSPTFELYITKQEMQEALDEMNRIIDNRGDPSSTPKNT